MTIGDLSARTIGDLSARTIGDLDAEIYVVLASAASGVREIKSIADATAREHARREFIVRLRTALKEYLEAP